MNSQHEWIVDGPAPTIDAHSIAKHGLLDSCLTRYVSVIAANPRQPQMRLALIDGFAGGGDYRSTASGEVHFGSPFVMLRAMQQAQAVASEKRGRPFDLDVTFYFIEKNRNASQRLRINIAQSEFKDLLTTGRIHILNDEYESQSSKIVDAIRNRSRKGRAIFVLDQCGYTGVPMSSIQKTLHALPNAEVILTFPVDHMIDFLSADEEALRLQQETWRRIDLDLDVSDVLNAKDSDNARRVIQAVLHRQIPVKARAAFYTPFFLKSIDSRKDLWLIHLSNHFRARDVMVGIHWETGTDFSHYGGSGLEMFGMFGYNELADVSLTHRPLLPIFSFDHTAREQCISTICTQLPSVIPSKSHGLTLRQLFELCSNGTPATSMLLKQCIVELRANGELQTVSHENNKVHERQEIHWDDILRRPPQGRLFL